MPDTPMIGSPVVIATNGQTFDSAASGVSWPAIIGGAFAAAALSLILVALGSGLGLASVSPWRGAGASATTFTVVAAVWLIVTQWLASGLGGYLTGRLRVKWTGLHAHEALFRDTANGFLAWATATVIGAALLASAASAVISETATMAGTVQPGSRPAAGSADPTAYFVDSLYRSDHPATNAPDADMRAQSGRILLNGLLTGEVPESDKTWLAQLVAARTGLSRTDAETRVNDVLTKEVALGVAARSAADAGRKAGSYLSVFIALSMVVGAFIACVAAAVGGRQRDAS